jgi:predicted dehydrogenase
MADRVRTAVIGVGAFGRHHARIYSQLAEAELVAIVDANPATRAEAAKTYGVPTFAAPDELPADVEAVSVAVPTQFHHRVALPLLARGVSVLIEKPMVRRLDEGRELIAAAEKSGAVLQVGHVERFNPAVRALRDHKIVPRYIEAARVAPFPFRSTDVGVVLDLMIHDIDIVLHLAGSPVKSVEAIGVPVLMTTEDIANARITFENGCVASLTASRVATKSERKVRVFSRDSYLVLDFGRREGYLYKKSPEFTPDKVQALIGQAVAGGKSTLADLQGRVFTDLLSMERLTIPEGDALTEEIRDFLRCVRDRSRPAVSGREGLAAVSVALDVLAAIERAAG